MKELSPCGGCYQGAFCGMKGLATNVRSILAENEEPLFGRPPECFYYVCGGGWTAARKRIQQAKRSKETGLLPFGTEHKPFIDNGIVKGRYVAYGADGYNDGDIIMVTPPDISHLTTNVLYYRPPSVEGLNNPPG